MMEGIAKNAVEQMLSKFVPKFFEGISDKYKSFKLQQVDNIEKIIESAWAWHSSHPKGYDDRD